MSLPWFKHFTSSHLGSSFEKLIAEADHETIACYWILLELIGRHESLEDRGRIEIPHRLLHKSWGVHKQRATRIIGKIMVNFTNTIFITICEQTYQVWCPKWLELQETRGGKRSSKIEQKSGRSKKQEVRSKNTPLPPKRGDYDFESLFQSYPRREGKAKGIATLAKTIKTDKDYQDLKLAIKNFCEHHKKTEPRYIPHFSTFVGSASVQAWRDYVSIENQESKKQKRSYFYENKKITEEEFFELKQKGLV